MPVFSYVAVDNHGDKVKAECFAKDVASLKQMLGISGMWLLQSNVIDVSKRTRTVKVNRQELIDLFSSFATMLQANIPILDTVKSVAQYTPNEGLQYTLNLVRDDIESGVPLSEAMAKHPNVFPKQVTSVIQAGEFSGQLPEVFKDLKSYYQWLHNLMKDIKQASSYPIIVFFVVCLFILVLFSFVVPRFEEMLLGLNIPLPFITSVILDISHFMVDYWAGLFIIPVLWLSINGLYKHSPAFSQSFDKFKLNIPIFGKINHMIALSRFAHHFSMMFRSGIQILDCLKHCRNLVGNAQIASAIKITETYVYEGRNMSEALNKHQVFPPMLLQIIKVGETTGTLDHAMSQLAAYYDDEVPKKIKHLFTVLEPLVMLILIGIVGTVAIAIFLPMVSMMGGIK